MLEIDGGTTASDWGYAELPLASGVTGDISISFDIWLATGAFTYIQVEAASGAAAYLEVSGDIYAYDFAPGGTTAADCGALTFAVSNTVELIMLGAGTYSVVINGTPSEACAGLYTESGADPTYQYVSFTDSESTGQGGIVYYDNIHGEVYSK
jgi:hypothetical protein